MLTARNVAEARERKMRWESALKAEIQLFYAHIKWKISAKLFSAIWRQSTSGGRVVLKSFLPLLGRSYEKWNSLWRRGIKYFSPKKNIEQGTVPVGREYWTVKFLGSDDDWNRKDRRIIVVRWQWVKLHQLQQGWMKFATWSCKRKRECKVSRGCAVSTVQMFSEI